MATSGDLPRRGYGAGARKYVVLRGFSPPGDIQINLSPVVVEVVHPAIGVDVPWTVNLAPVIVHATIPAISVATPTNTFITLAPVVVHTGILALANDVPTLPGAGTVTKGYIEDKPQITYDGSGLVNRIIPFGVDSDGSDLTLEFADPAEYHYVIKNDGDTWYIEDTGSIAKYGLFEQRIYRTDVKNPYLNKATGALVLGANPTAGDTFTLGADTYTYRAAPSVALDVALGATLPATRMNTYAALVAADGLNSPPAYAEVTSIDPTAIAAPTVDEFGNWTSLPPWAGMTAGDPSAIPLSAINPGPDGVVPTTSSFSSAANGFATDTLLGGQFVRETANVLYALAVNELIRRRSEILSVRVAVANGADIWALPGDRMQFTFNGVAETLEAESLGGSSRVTWLSIDRPMLVVERHDKSDASGVRRVEFVLACPMLEYVVPALPEWVDPVSLPVPGETGIGNEGPGADWLADALGDILTNNKLPFASCCPDPTTDIHRGTDLLPPTEPDPSAPFTPTVWSEFVPDPVLAGTLLDAWGEIRGWLGNNSEMFDAEDAIWSGAWTGPFYPNALGPPLGGTQIPNIKGAYATFTGNEYTGPQTWEWRDGTPRWSGTINGWYYSGHMTDKPGSGGTFGNDANWVWDIAREV